MKSLKTFYTCQLYGHKYMLNRWLDQLYLYTDGNRHKKFLFWPFYDYGTLNPRSPLYPVCFGQHDKNKMDEGRNWLHTDVHCAWSLSPGAAIFLCRQEQNGAYLTSSECNIHQTFTTGVSSCCMFLFLLHFSDGFNGSKYLTNVTDI